MLSFDIIYSFFLYRGEDDGEEYETDEDGSWMDGSDADTDDQNSSDMGDNVPSLKGMRMKNEDMKSSRFTEYSMSSSVMKRNDQLTLLDDRFEQVQHTQIQPSFEITVFYVLR